MAPRKSVASSSRTTLDAIPPADVAESLTPDYVPPQGTRADLTKDEREKLMHEILCMPTRDLLFDIAEHARNEIFANVRRVEDQIRPMVAYDGRDAEREVDIGLHALETLLESHVDKAFDKFIAWSLRNAFDVPADLEVVLPWHKGYDFNRGIYVASLPRGEESVLEDLDQFRAKVEHMRLLSIRLGEAQTKLDRRLDIAKQRKAEVGFVKDILTSSNLSPLQPKAQNIMSSLSTLHETVASLNPDSLYPASSTVPQGTKAWELGKQAYLNWAVGKMIHPAGKENGKERGVEDVELEMEASGGLEGIERLSRSTGV